MSKFDTLNEAIEELGTTIGQEIRRAVDAGNAEAAAILGAALGSVGVCKDLVNTIVEILGSVAILGDVAEARLSNPNTPENN